MVLHGNQCPSADSTVIVTVTEYCISMSLSWPLPQSPLSKHTLYHRLSSDVRRRSVADSVARVAETPR